MAHQSDYVKMNVDENTFTYVIYDSDVVIYDEAGGRVVSCPTELEALEYIMEKISDE